ncbi:hypothetical protein VTN77DRAFT_208 [Rasamsonia byssochlamydoides]|uniref:uncharacterized protein n=1 Tax=Rasamsonia byssochlamydoides TaxID=89139 RepID=UPI003742B5BC
MPRLATDWEDQRLHGNPSSPLRDFRQIHFRRPRTRVLRVIFLTTAISLCFIFFLSRGSGGDGATSDYWSQYPSLPLSQPPDDLRVISHEAPPVGEDGTLPSHLEKSNPSFHILIPAVDKNVGLCQTITSAMILNYPPPTLIKSGPDLSSPPTAHDAMVAHIKGIVSFLKNSKRVNERDLILIVDGSDTFFQLPPEILIQRFHTILQKNNQKLREKYGVAVVENEKGAKEVVQKYSQRVIFAASKECFPNRADDVACVSVPSSPLPPDVYGPKTDIQKDGHRNRPRWLDSGAVIGQAADLLPLYERVLEYVAHHRDRHGDQMVLSRLYGTQEYVRELERRRTSSRFMEWLRDMIGISEATNITNVYLRLEPGQRYEFGIGVDYESQLFFTMKRSRNDVEWITYNNISQASTAQMRHGVPREVRLTLPVDIEQNASNPFIEPARAEGEVVKPPFNETVDALPHPKNMTWNTLPLMTNVHSSAVPATIHLNGDPVLRPEWWSNMWYHPWARALVRKYMRSSRGRLASQSSLLGGSDWWDERGGAGGVWTNNDEWMDFEELCSGFEDKLFDDGLGAWGQEDGGIFQKPIYNQWGILIAGKGPPNLNLEEGQEAQKNEATGQGK